MPASAQAALVGDQKDSRKSEDDYVQLPLAEEMLLSLKRTAVSCALLATVNCVDSFSQPEQPRMAGWLGVR
jgi:hypothetical protein